VISPYARANVVDHTLIDQSSTLRFIEDNWLDRKRISQESFDNRAGSIDGMLDFRRSGQRAKALLLDPPTGAVLHGNPRAAQPASLANARASQHYVASP